MKKLLIILSSALIGLYILFLLLPIFVSPVINAYNSDISKAVEDTTGFRTKLGKIYLITTPKLTTGLKVNSIELSIPTGEKFFYAENFKIKLSLLPLLLRKVELDIISLDKVSANLKVRQDGHFLIEEFIPQPEIEEQQNTNTTTGLPLGIKLSNHLPNIVLKNYDITLVDMLTKKEYEFNGNNIKISDFILDKKIKVEGHGKVILNKLEQFTYDIKVLNEIMPKLVLNDIIFNPEPHDSQTSSIDFNIIDFLKSINQTELTAKLNGDIKISGTQHEPEIKGFVDIENMTLLVDGKKTPESFAKIKANGNKIDMNINLNSFNNETSKLVGYLKTGKSPKIDIQVVSNTQLNNIFRTLNSLARSFKYNDLQTLTATGKLDANFKIKTNLKKVESSGYLKIPTGSINYGLYNIAIKNIVADVAFDNKLDIKNICLEILGQPLKIFGTIQNNSDTDLHITADKLLIKGLLAAAGQVQVLKENIFNSGTLSMDAHLKGKLSNLVPEVNLTINNVDIKNKPSSTRITLPNANLIVNTEGKTYSGNILANNLTIINPLAKITLPESSVTIGEKDININNAYLMLDNSRIDITGKISNYINDKLNINLKADGYLFASDVKTIIPKEFKDFITSSSGKLPISIKISGDLKSQDISVNITADDKNYVTLLDTDILKGHKTIINSDIKLIDDSAKLTNTGIYIDNLNNIAAKLEGSVNKLSKTQNLNLRLTMPKTINMVIPTLKGSNMAIRGDLDITGTVADPYLKGLVTIPSITIPDMDLTMTNTVANINGPMLKGNGTVQTFKFGEIKAENLASEFSLKNYSIFYLNKLMGDAYNGKISGDISYGINDGKIGIKMAGSDLNAVKAIEGLSGIKNALSGTLNFDIDVTTKGATDVEILKNMLGKLTFNINNGKFLNVGRFDSLLYAQNILGNAILKTAVTAVTDTPIIQNTAEFKTINGSMTFKNAVANINPISVAGNLMSYYISGTYNLLNSTTNVTILGRLDSKVVAVLGPLGDLSVDKLTSFIPKFGAATAAIINTMTSNPDKEKTENIPALSSGSENYKDFKVEFNGGIESTSSVKSFKWLSSCDVSSLNYKDEYNKAKDSIINNLQGTTQQIKDTKQNIKNQIEDTKQQFNDAKQQIKDIKNLFKVITTETPDTGTPAESN